MIAVIQIAVAPAVLIAAAAVLIAWFAGVAVFWRINSLRKKMWDAFPSAIREELDNQLARDITGRDDAKIDDILVVG